MVSTYWWRAKANFGDLLSEPLLAHFAGLEVEWAAPKDAQLMCVGSNLQMVPEGWSGVVAGTGKLRDSPVRLAEATILGLRGRLTAEGVRGDFVLGDPALLIDELVPRGKPEYLLGVVPHWSDEKLARRFAHLNPRVIDPAQDALTVVSEISKCKKIVASSLHGIIVADAYGIPRRAEMFAQMDVEGGVFKFEDYASVIGLPMEFGVLQSPSRKQIETIQQELFEMFLTVPRAL